VWCGVVGKGVTGQSLNSSFQNRESSAYKVFWEQNKKTHTISPDSSLFFCSTHYCLFVLSLVIWICASCCILNLVISCLCFVDGAWAHHFKLFPFGTGRPARLLPLLPGAWIRNRRMERNTVQQRQRQRKPRQPLANPRKCKTNHRGTKTGTLFYEFQNLQPHSSWWGASNISPLFLRDSSSSSSSSSSLSPFNSTLYGSLQQASELKQRLEDFSDKVRVNPKRGCMMLAVCRGKVRGRHARWLKSNFAHKRYMSHQLIQNDSFVLIRRTTRFLAFFSEWHLALSTSNHPFKGERGSGF